MIEVSEIKFKQLWHCQNGHGRWAYFKVITQRKSLGDTELKMTWGKRNCQCPTFEIGEGYFPYGKLILKI